MTHFQIHFDHFDLDHFDHVESFLDCLKFFEKKLPKHS